MRAHSCAIALFCLPHTLRQIEKFRSREIWCPWVQIHLKHENRAHAKRRRLCFGAPAGIRTPDTLLKRQVLCRLSYWDKSTVQKNQNKSLSFVLERRIGGADTKPVGTGEAFTQLRSGASPIRRGWDGGTRTHNIRVKVWCVTVTLRPTVQWKMGTGIIPIPVFVGWVKGLEPSTPGTTIRCSAN